MFLTAFRGTRYDPEVGGGTSLQTASKDVVSRGYEFDRLERAVVSLVEQHERMQKSNHELRVSLREREARIGELEEKLLEANQRRQDVVKRIDELVGQLDQLDARLESQERES